MDGSQVCNGQNNIRRYGVVWAINIAMDGGFSSDKIRDIIREIKRQGRGMGEGQRIAVFREKYPEFFEKFPKLFMAAINDSFDTKLLDLMLKQRDVILTAGNKETFDKVNAEMNEGLNERYVYPVVPKEQLEALRKKSEE